MRKELQNKTFVIFCHANLHVWLAFEVDVHSNER